MNELLVIINLATALSRSYSVDITRLDIQYNEKEDTIQAYLHLDGHTTADYKIAGDGTISIVKEEEAPAETAAEALESMKAAVDNLEVPKKPKALTVEPPGKKRSKDRQGQILKLYKEGWTKVKMAEELGIGLSTINYHIQALRDKGKI